MAGAKQVARAAHFEVAHGNGITRSQRGIISQNFQPLFAFRGGGAAFVLEQVGIGSLSAAPNTTSQLVKLSQAKGVSAVNDQGVGVGDIQTGFNN